MAVYHMWYDVQSQGMREAEINVAEGKKKARILTSEAYKAEQMNQAQGLEG